MAERLYLPHLEPGVYRDERPAVLPRRAGVLFRGLHTGGSDHERTTQGYHVRDRRRARTIPLRQPERWRPDDGRGAGRNRTPSGKLGTGIVSRRNGVAPESFRAGEL